MVNIYENLKSHISEELRGKAAATLNEEKSKVSKAVSVILPSLLGKLADKGDTPEIRAILEESGDQKRIGDLDAIFEGHGVQDGMNLGERFENALIGVDSKGFHSAVASHTGIKSESADRLTNWVSATVAAYIGNKIVVDHQSVPGLFAELKKEKNTFLKDIPDGVFAKLGLGTRTKSQPAAAVKTEAKTVPAPAKKKGGMGWLKWLIFILLLLLLILWWRSCNMKKKDAVMTKTEQVAAPMKPVAQAPAQADANGMVTLTLPKGDKITVKKGGCEYNIVEFLNSEEYRKDSEKDLSNKWFHFDYIDFEFNSSTELTEGSQKQLQNLIVILKNYPESKIKIGGFADKIGSKEVNQEISVARANHIMEVFEKGNISEKRILTQGFGEEYAKRPVTAPDSLRALDRHIALRFVK